MINKSKILYIVFLFLLLSYSYSFSFEEIEGVYIKIALDENRYLQLDLEKKNPHNRYLSHTVSSLIKSTFSIKSISTEYYSEKVSTVKNNHIEIKIYHFDPIFNDRFKHILWIYEDGRLYKQEVYDLSDKLLYSYEFKTNNVKKIPPKSEINGGFYFYKGFKLVYSGKNNEDENQLLFSDGLNNFSVFWKKHLCDFTPLRRIIFGNYMLRKCIDDFLVTVVGTIPYFEMEKVVKYLIKKEVIK
ncbi:hypothetical protein OWM07_01735 [Deferribacter thermophilus]|uniref:hypothetical protein n=1 Tax=Deferribacter thermophilus TaxID=53573 RepID=UPI003C1EB124